MGQLKNFQTIKINYQFILILLQVRFIVKPKIIQGKSEGSVESVGRLPDCCIRLTRMRTTRERERERESCSWYGQLSTVTWLTVETEGCDKRHVVCRTVMVT